MARPFWPVDPEHPAHVDRPAGCLTVGVEHPRHAALDLNCLAVQQTCHDAHVVGDVGPAQRFLPHRPPTGESRPEADYHTVLADQARITQL